MLDIVDGQEQLVIMAVGAAAIFRAPVGHHSALLAFGLPMY